MTETTPLVEIWQPVKGGTRLLALIRGIKKIGAPEKVIVADTWDELDRLVGEYCMQVESAELAKLAVPLKKVTGRWRADYRTVKEQHQVQEISS